MIFGIGMLIGVFAYLFAYIIGLDMVAAAVIIVFVAFIYSVVVVMTYKYTKEKDRGV